MDSRGRELTPRADTMASWDSIPEARAPLSASADGGVCRIRRTCRRTSRQAHRWARRTRIRENTLVFYIWGDNGSSAEGRTAPSASCWPRTKSLIRFRSRSTRSKKIGGLEVLGGPKVDSMYHAGWAWAGDTPFKHTKLVASHFGGTRNPMTISWPAGIQADKMPRSQFHHVNHIAQTIYEVLNITPSESRGRLRAGSVGRKQAWLHLCRRRLRSGKKAHGIF